MSASEAVVDVSYRGFELGKRVRISQFGPTTAYLEHPAPLPVGTRLEISIDPDREGGGDKIAATVLRVCEQVAGAERASGMHVRATDLAGAAAAWWGERVAHADPQIPEQLGAAPVAAAARIDEAPEDTEVTAPLPRVEPETKPSTTQVMEAVRQEELRRQTTVMSTDEIREAIGQDPELADLVDLAEEPEPESDPGVDVPATESGGNGDPRERQPQGKRRGKGRAAKRRKR